MSDDLERLRREGAAKLDQAAREEREREDERANERLEHEHVNVRLAVGRYRYRALRRAVYIGSMPALLLFVVGLIATVFDLVKGWGIALVPISLGWLFGGLWLWSSELVWRASRGAMREERRWASSRPFELRGYFEWLAHAGSRMESVRLEIRGPGLAARHEDLRMLLAAIHPKVAYEKDGRATDLARFRLTEIPGREDDHCAEVLHDVVDRVLVPLHAEAPIESVTLVR